MNLFIKGQKIETIEQLLALFDGFYDEINGETIIMMLKHLENGDFVLSKTENPSWN